MPRITVTTAGETTTLDYDTRPTGPDYTRFEDLYRTGDTASDGTMDLRAILSRLTTPKIVTFPEGQFAARDFNSGYLAGLHLPTVARGIVGSGKGTLGGTGGTVFTMKPMSSTKGNGAKDANGNLYVPVQDDKTPCQLAVLKQMDQTQPAVFRNFQVAGADQGHIFSAFQVYNAGAQVTVEDVLITGWEGNAGAPPGETSALAVHSKESAPHIIHRVEVDGRRVPNGPVLGAMGMTFQNTIGATFNSCYSHHCRAANLVGWQAFDCTVIDCVMDAASAGMAGIGNGGLNLERCAGWTLTRPTITGRKNRVHITHSSDDYTLKLGTVTRNTTTAKAALTIIDPTWNDLWGDNLLYVQSWLPYNGSNLMAYPNCVPVVSSSAGAHIPYEYVAQQHYLVS